MFEQCLFTFGLFARTRSTVVPVLAAMDPQVSPAATTCVPGQTWPKFPRHSVCRRCNIRQRRVCSYATAGHGAAYLSYRRAAAGQVDDPFVHRCELEAAIGIRLSARPRNNGRRAPKAGLTSTRSPWRRYRRRCHRGRLCRYGSTCRPPQHSRL